MLNLTPLEVIARLFYAFVESIAEAAAREWSTLLMSMILLRILLFETHISYVRYFSLNLFACSLIFLCIRMLSNLCCVNKP